MGVFVLSKIGDRRIGAACLLPSGASKQAAVACKGTAASTLQWVVISIH